MLINMSLFIRTLDVIHKNIKGKVPQKWATDFYCYKVIRQSYDFLSQSQVSNFVRKVYDKVYSKVNFSFLLKSFLQTTVLQGQGDIKWLKQNT